MILIYILRKVKIKRNIMSLDKERSKEEGGKEGEVGREREGGGGGGGGGLRERERRVMLIYYNAVYAGVHIHVHIP